MNHDPDGLVTRIELWRQWADAHGVCYDDVGKSFDDVARDLYQTSEACPELLTPEARGDGLSATHQAEVKSAYAWVPLMEAAIERRGGDPRALRRPRPGTRSDGRIVPPQRRPESMGEWEEVAPVPAAAPEEPPQQEEAPTTDTGFRP